MKKNLIIIVLLLSQSVFSQSPGILSISPSFNQIATYINPVISVTFNANMDSSTFSEITFAVLGERSGYHSGIILYNDQNITVTFQSQEFYNSGERVKVSLSNQIKSIQGDPLKGFSWVFRIPADEAPMNFSEPIEYGGVSDYMQSVDINNDNYPDIATSSGIIWLNDGNGVFSEYWLLPGAADFAAIVVDDFNRDNNMDVFFEGNDGLKIGIGNGEGNFSLTKKPFWFYDYSSSDLNCDGYPDIFGLSGVTYLPPDSTTLNWSIAFNDGTGNFSDTVLYKVGGGGKPERIITTDLDYDGDFDVVIASHPEVNPNGIFGLNGFIIGENDGLGNFNAFTLYYTDDIQYPYYLYASDFNNDGFCDIAVISSGGGIVELNNGDGTFSLDSISSRWYWPGELSSPITGGDINGDNWIDIVISGYEWPPAWQIPYYAVNINNQSYFPGFWNVGFKDTLPDGQIRATSIVDLNNDAKADIIHCGNGIYITFSKDSVLSVKENNSSVSNFGVFQNYPNPFNPKTNIKYSIPERGYVTIKVYDVLGNTIKTLVSEEKSSGIYEIEFDATRLSSGAYYYRISAGNFSETKKMLLIK